MSRSASATSEAPGNKIRAKSRLNSSIFGQRWFEFPRQLEYKLAWNDGFEEHADPVGAIHSKRAGHARFACEVRGAVMLPAAGIHQSNCPEAHAQVLVKSSVFRPGRMANSEGSFTDAGM